MTQENYAKNSKSDVPCAAREPISTEVVSFAERLANRAQQLSERVNEKLHPVMTSEASRQGEGTVKEVQEYPPLFADLRNNFKKIAGALDSIEHAVSRTEL